MSESNEKQKLMSQCKITDSMLQQKCSEEHLLEIEKFISWQEVGRRLPKIGRAGVMDIERDGFDEAKRRQKLIDMWAQKTGDEATYDQMVTAMIKAEKINEATKVCKLLTPQSGQFSRKWIR